MTVAMKTPKTITTTTTTADMRTYIVIKAENKRHQKQINNCKAKTVITAIIIILTTNSKLSSNHTEILY